MKYSNSSYRLLAVLLLPFFLLLSSWIASAQDSVEIYQVQSGDNLELIAKQVRPESDIKLETVTQYLYSNNRSAFSKGRIDSLIVGSELKLPSAAEWADMPRLDASAPALSEYTFQPEGRDRSSVAGPYF